MVNKGQALTKNEAENKTHVLFYKTLCSHCFLPPPDLNSSNRRLTVMKAVLGNAKCIASDSSHQMFSAGLITGE